MMDEPTDITLSQAGQARRDAMLDELLRRMRRRHHLRKARRWSMAMAMLGALTVAASILARSTVEATGHASRTAGITSDASNHAPEVRSRVLVEYVTTDPGALDRLRAKAPRHAYVVMIDDDRLLDELVAINRPTGLIRIGGHTRLTRDVTTTDEDTREPSAERSPSL